ncbi:hypothetical protein GALMADRAFT_213525 [Galerina marginata CBS 339.88]|uniref:Uncharacterized protein n=1 Tax=Galerina marginata (strain CBS 339.88) TaxID=685588 RepID=A0A067SPW4_GALM3|nr:hypothetical protein GALMADRAFT_213525 [Galerina marginata CBS 339.88]
MGRLAMVPPKNGNELIPWRHTGNPRTDELCIRYKDDASHKIWQDMEYFVNKLPFFQPASDDIELDDMEAGSRSTHYTDSESGPSYTYALNPDSRSVANIAQSNPDSRSGLQVPTNISLDRSGPNNPDNTSNPYAPHNPSSRSAPRAPYNSGPALPAHPDDMPIDNDTSFNFAYPLPSESIPSTESAPPAGSSSSDIPAIPLLSPFDIGTGRKRSQNNDGVNKVRVVEQKSTISNIREIGQRLGQRYEDSFKKTAKEYQEMTDERLKQAQQQLASAKQQADEATKQAEASRVREQEIERVKAQAEELNRSASEKLLEAVRRAEEAERQAEAKIKATEEKYERAMAEMQKKFMDAMQRLEASIGQTESMEVDAPSRRHIKTSNAKPWRETTEDDSEDEARADVQDLLVPQPQITGPSHTVVRNDDEECSF